MALHASLLLQQQQQQQRQAALQQAQQLQRQQAQHNFRMDPHIQFRKNSDPTPTVGGNHSGGDRGIILDRSTEKRRAASDDYVCLPKLALINNLIKQYIGNQNNFTYLKILKACVYNFYYNSDNHNEL